MSDNQKKAMEKLAENINNWNDEQRGYLLGYIEGVTQANKMEEEKPKE